MAPCSSMFLIAFALALPLLSTRGNIFSKSALIFFLQQKTSHSETDRQDLVDRGETEMKKADHFIHSVNATLPFSRCFFWLRFSWRLWTSALGNVLVPTVSKQERDTLLLEHFICSITSSKEKLIRLTAHNRRLDIQGKRALHTHFIFPSLFRVILVWIPFCSKRVRKVVVHFFL